jgi:hypothetical protein
MSLATPRTQAGHAAVRALDPGALAADGRADAKRIEAGRTRGIGQQQLRGLAEQGGGGPAQGRIGRDEGETAGSIGLERNIRSHGGEMPPPRARQ